MRYVEINDERFNKGLRIRYKIFNELEFSETKVICRGSVCANVKQSRIVTIPNVDHVSAATIRFGIVFVLLLD